jgi:hypothetical protein
MANGGFHEDLKTSLGFQDLAEDNSFAKYFPGLMKLLQNATVDDLAALLAQLEMRFLS